MIYKLVDDIKDNDIITLGFSNKRIFDIYSWRINDVHVRHLKGKFIITHCYGHKIVILMDG